MSHKNMIVLHGTASSWGEVDVVRQWHLERGWLDIGYNLLITNGYLTHEQWQAKRRSWHHDGRVWFGRDLNDNPHDALGEVGAHTLGYNRESIGIAMVSDPHMLPTRAQIRSTLIACTYIVNLYQIEWQKVVGHYELNTQKIDPYLNMDEFRDYLVRGVMNWQLPDQVFDDILDREVTRT